MKLLKLTKGKQALLDDQDYDWAKQFKWCAVHSGNTYYVQRRPGPEGKQLTLILHRELLRLIKGDKREIDHINGNGLDNRRINLRICSHRENTLNKNKKNSHSSSKFKGVSWDKQHGKWHSQLWDGEKNIHLGRYHSELEAAQAYDVAAKKYFGDYAKTNF